MQEILDEWTAFAEKTAPPDGSMSALALTDHAEAMLQAIVRDIETHQSVQQQYDKSQGDPGDDQTQESAAAIHGRLRHANNFSLLQLSSEFRALRATVLRLWLPHVGQMSATINQEMIRFNEAIDEALADSIITYSQRADRTRDLFLAVLGHDLRAPLASISLIGELLTRASLPPEQLAGMAQKAKRNAMLMSAMITDLLGYSRLQMAAGMPVLRAPVDILALCQAAVADAHAMYPDASIEFRHDGVLRGEFDAVRLQQLVTNLLINAAQHSDKASAVAFDAIGGDDAITLRVRNFGAVIPRESLTAIFQPLVQLEPEDVLESKPRTSLGLGLYIAHETAIAHDGAISVSSSATGGTVFTASFPRATHRT